jgi:hypothetical protein
VLLTVRGEPFSAEFLGTLLGDLRAGLRDQGIDVCRGDSGRGSPIARVSLSSSEQAPLRVGIDVVDAVTDKRLGRDVDLGRLPEDGRPFALAVATDELLRASWVELALEKRERPPKSAPPEVQQAALDSLPAKTEPASAPQDTPPPSAPSVQREPVPAAGVRLALEHFAAGQTHVGVDVALRLPIASAFGVEFAAGARKGLSVQTQSGTVSSSALGAEGSLWLGLASSDSVELELCAGVRALRVSFDANAVAGAGERDSSNWAVTARSGLGLRLGRTLRAGLRAGAGVPLLSVEISEGERVISGVAGLELFAESGLSVEF